MGLKQYWDSGVKACCGPGRHATSSAYIIIPLLLTALHYSSLKFSHSFPSHITLFIFYFLTVILLPGFSISLLVLPKTNIPIRILASMILGTAFAYCVLFLFSVLNRDIYYAGVLIPAATPLALALLPCLPGNFKRDGGDSRMGGNPLPPLSTALLIGLIIFVCFIVFFKGDSLPYNSDSPDHIAYIRTISRSHEAFPDQNLYRDGGMLTRDIRKGLYHSMWGMLNTLTGHRDVVPVWPVVSAVGSVFTILSIFCAGLLLFRSPAIGLLAAYLRVLVYNGGLTNRLLITAAYSFPFGTMFSISFLLFALRYLTGGRKRYLALAVASSVASSGTHVTHLLLNIFTISFLSIASLIEKIGGRRWELIRSRILPLSLITAAANAPYLILRYVRDYAPNNEIHTHLQGVFKISEKLYILSPFIYLAHYWPLALLSILGLFLLWKHSKTDMNLRLLLWGLIALYAILFNPLLTPLLIERITYLIIRFHAALPSTILAACLLVSIWRKLRGESILLSSKAAVICGSFAVVVLALALGRTPSGFAYSNRNIERMNRYSSLNLAGLYSAINESVPEGSVIASDPITSYCLPAFTDQYIICTNGQHSIPNDSTALERVLDSRTIFRPDSPMRDIVQVLDKYEAGYLVINGRIPTLLMSLYWKPGPAVMDRVRKRMLRSPGRFEPLYDRDSMTLLKYTRGGEESDGEDSLLYPYPTGSNVSKAELGYTSESGEPGIFIRDIGLSSGTVKRGENLVLSIEWIASGECTPQRYSSVIRFDTDFERGRLYHRAYGKLYRKIREYLKGQRYRFSIEHMPFQGLYSPDLWPANRVVEDSASVRIPKDIAPGVYSISIRMFRKIQYPNYTLKDIFTNDDFYNGIAIKTVIIE